MLLRRLLLIAISILCSIGIVLLIITYHAWDIKSLKDGYVLTYWAREIYQIEYRSLLFSWDSHPVLKDSFSEIDYSSNWIFIKTKASRYWIIDKYAEYEEIDNDLSSFIFEPEFMVFTNNVIGPLDSISFEVFKDSVSFESFNSRHWNN